MGPPTHSIAAMEDGFLALGSADGRYEDRRKGLRDLLDGSSAAALSCHAIFETAPSSWHMGAEPSDKGISPGADPRVLPRSPMMSVDQSPSRSCASRKSATATSLHDIVSFDPDDINGAMGELTARWIASGEVAHPEVIERRAG